MWVSLAAWLLSILFPLAALVTGLRNAAIFEAPALVGAAPLPAILAALALMAALVASRRSARLRENLPALALFLSFSTGYFLLASIFNKQELNTNNIYFAADSSSWYWRMAAPFGWDIATRAVHPLAHVIFRPLTAALSLLTGGDRFHANLLLLGLAGGGCVWLAYQIVRPFAPRPAYAVLFASLLGLSTSHLVFASVVESYIFSAFCLLLFTWLLARKASLIWLAASGALTLGITVTNFGQQVLADFFVQRNLKRLAALVVIVVAAGAAANILARSYYPTTDYFFLPQNMLTEKKYAQTIDARRLGLMTENLLVYNVVAPQPYFHTREQSKPRFNFLPGSIAEYAWFGWPALGLWLAACTLAVFQFARNLRRDTPAGRLSLALLACLAFNFALHLNYGVEPFLYSADWTYALTLFVALNLGAMANHRWFSPALLALLAAVFVNQVWFVYLLAGVVGPFLAGN
ncbi:MAG: hypothetical protein ACOYYJ_15415 [Chloroflexota bacterium]